MPARNPLHFARLILENATDFAIVTTDLEGSVTSWNPRAEQLLGWTSAEAVGCNACMIFTPEDQAIGGCDKEMRLARETGRAEDERWHMRKDGSRFWASGLLMRFEDEQSGEHIGYLKMMRDRTPQHEAEERVRASEARYRQIVEGAEDFAIIALDSDGTVTSWNSGAERITGFGEAEALGRPGGIIFTPEDRAAGVPTHEMNCAATDSRSPNERWHVKKDGSRFWGSGLIMRLDQPGGGYLKIFRDATVEHLAATRLRDSEAQFRLMADAVPQIVWITDAEGRTEFFNKQWTNYTGIPYEPTTAAEVAATHVHPDDAERTMAAFEEAKRSGTTFAVEHRIRSASGDWRWFLVRAEPYRDPESGGVVRWFGASADIHDRKTAEEALQALNADLEHQIVERSRERGLIWRHSLDLLSVIDLGTGCFDAASPAWTTALGWPTAEIEGRSYAGFVHPDDARASAGAFDQVRAGNPVLRFENRYRTQDGDWRWLSWVAVPENGKLYSVTRDVTVEKERQAELEAAQEALRQSQKMEAMGQLTGGVAHDFNNLLTPIVGSLDLLQMRGVGGEREQRLIAGALQSAERAKTLVQRLLAFARRQPLQAVPVDIGELVAGMGDLVASTTGPQIRVSVETADDLPPAKADPNQLEMALLNLAVNARDAMPDGGTLRISAELCRVGSGHRSKLRPGPFVRLSVADTGGGMDEATLQRAIEPFFSTKGIGKGTGLGLSMVHGLASQLGGTMIIESRVGMGTNVELWLPVSEAAGQEMPHAPLPPPGQHAGLALLVDDEELVRVATAEMLEDLGYRVVEVASAEEALAMMSGGLMPELLVTDHLMPGMTGSDLARQVRERFPQLPVLLVSGYAEDDGVPPDLPRLTKPFRQADLAASLAGL